jgi:hypothetical protein
MKSIYMSKSKPSPGFDVKSYNKQTTKAGKDFKRNSKVIKLSGIQGKDQRGSNEYTTRVSTVKLKPREMTYGGSKGNKGVTIYRKGKA